MSLDSSSGCVTSKYFSGQSAMDESLSDFQEAKKSFKGPKPAQKPNKPKTRKVTKRIKGQKDIRTALKGNRNELVSYSKEFDTVCKKSGLDVDSEQLQLAIALSKSLQTESSSNLEDSQALSSQQRVAKIRKTLQEYGFKVPEAKVTINKRSKKVRKHYKLLTISAEEKHQNITKKFSQIIFKNLDDSKLSQNNYDANARVFFVATNLPYESMKDNNVFYVEGLIEKSTSSGSLLRDWAEIPGRPQSPNLSFTDIMNFKDIDCSQDELDVVLSGSLKSVKSIIATKEIKYEDEYGKCDVPKIILDDDGEIIVGENKSSENESPLQSKTPVKLGSESVTKEYSIISPVKVFSPNNEVIEIKSPIKEVLVNHKPFEDNVTALETINKPTTYTQQYRSCSPDIFDDDISSIIDNTKPINVLSQEHKTKVFNEDNFMDLTQCANILSQNTDKNSQNITKRKSNDFMEITECIVGSSQPIREEIKEIDLTQTPEEKSAREEIPIIKNNKENLGFSTVHVEQYTNGGISKNITEENNEIVLTNHPANTDEINDNIDLTQSSNEDDRRITVTEGNNQTPERNFDDMDLTQSSASTDIDDLPLVEVANSQTQKSLDDTIIMNEEQYLDISKMKKSMIFDNDPHKAFDLTQAQGDSKQHHSSYIGKSKEPCNASFYEDFVHDHSENTENTENDKDGNSDYNNKSKEFDDIDLTQASDTSEERIISPRSVTPLENIPNNSSLGKRYDVSIDYDEILINDDNVKGKESFKGDKSLDLKNDSYKPETYHDVEIVYANDVDINSSQNSEVFHISDKELDYSLHKSRHDYPRDNFDFGEVSLLDNLTNLASFRKSLSEACTSNKDTNKNVTTEDSFLPEVNVKKSDEIFRNSLIVDAHNPTASSPIKVHEILNSDDGIIYFTTPKKTEYILKMNDVTPMADYASMSTPQRNRELDKYGLKPLKRKRAVKILTHIYNQLHPTIQILDEDQPSPAKKPRVETYTQDSSPKKLPISPTFSPLKKTPVKSYESPLRRLEREPHPSPRKTEELKSDRNIFGTPSPKKTERLKRDREFLCTPSPKKNDRIKDVCSYEVTSEVAIIKSIDCSPNDWVFQRKEKAKVHSCRVPLHIAFHNYVLSRRSLREAILKYEPVNIDVIHKDLVGYGHRYDPKDLLKFLDKKCITVKTTDNNSRNNKR